MKKFNKMHVLDRGERRIVGRLASVGFFFTAFGPLSSGFWKFTTCYVFIFNYIDGKLIEDATRRLAVYFFPQLNRGFYHDKNLQLIDINIFIPGRVCS